MGGHDQKELEKAGDDEPMRSQASYQAIYEQLAAQSGDDARLAPAASSGAESSEPVGDAGAAGAAAALSTEPDTSSDALLARLLAEAGESAAAPPRPDTSMDHAVALQLHEDEVDRLCGRSPPPDVSPSCDFDGLIRSLLSGSRLLRLVPRPNPAGPPSPGGRDRERDRLLHRLAFYGLAEKQVQGDGNCQFSALSDQLFRSPGHHAGVRARVAGQLLAHPERYAPFVPGGEFGAYVAAMARPGTWGDHVTLQAAADAWGIRIYVVSSFLDNCVIEIVPQEEDPTFANRALYLSFWAEVHYNSIYPASDRARLPPRTVLGSRTLQQGLDAVRGAAGWLMPG